MVWPRATVLPNWRFCVAWLLLSGGVTDRLAGKPGLPARVSFGDVGGVSGHGVGVGLGLV